MREEGISLDDCIIVSVFLVCGVVVELEEYVVDKNYIKLNCFGKGKVLYVEV